MTSWRPEIKESYHNSEHYSTAYPDLPTEPGVYKVMELWRVVEWKAGAVFKTRQVSYVWVPMGTQLATFIEGGTHFMLISLSTTTSEKWMNQGHNLMTRVRDKS